MAVLLQADLLQIREVFQSKSVQRFLECGSRLVNRCFGGNCELVNFMPGVKAGAETVQTIEKLTGVLNLLLIDELKQTACQLRVAPEQLLLDAGLHFHRHEDNERLAALVKARRPPHRAIHRLLLSGRPEAVVNKGKIKLVVRSVRGGAKPLDFFNAKIVLEKSAQFLDLGNLRFKDTE